LDFAPLAPDYREKINTPLTFLNHMIEHIAWRSGINIETTVDLDKFCLTHVICEDLGIALGKAVAEYLRRSAGCGIVGFGDAYGIIDEARAHSLISFESRTYFDLDTNGISLEENVEGMYREDLETFLLGFAQGANCTLQIVLEKGENGHHAWEAIFRSLGSTLKNALESDESRIGRTAGVAGAIDWQIR
jgi:imidazoleglycerol-phosphate dehydratase